MSTNPWPGPTDAELGLAYLHSVSGGVERLLETLDADPCNCNTCIAAGKFHAAIAALDECAERVYPLGRYRAIQIDIGTECVADAMICELMAKEMCE